MCKLTCCRNCLFPLLFLRFCCRHHHASFPNDVAAHCPDNATQQPIWCGGCRADSSDANKDAHRHLVGRVLPIAWYESLRIPTYNTTRNQPTMSVDASWPKWPIAAAMVPHSWRWRIQQLPRMLADCRMRWRREWGTMEAVGWRQPPRLVGHGLASFS